MYAKTTLRQIGEDAGRDRAVRAVRARWPGFGLSIAAGLATLAGCGPGAVGVGTGSFADGTCVIPEIEARDGSLRIEHETRLGGEGDGPGLLTDVSGMTNAVRDGQGRYWLGQGDAVAVFGADGAYVGAVGRRGQGPLEFFRTWPFHVDAMNRVHVLDPANLRVTLVHEDLVTATQVSLPVPAFRMKALDDGLRYVFAGWVPTGDHAGQPVHVVEDGQIAASFGTEPGDVSVPPLDAMTAQWKILAIDDSGVVFVGADREYFVEAWAEDGRRLGRLRGPAMDNGPRRPGWSDDNPPPHRVRDIRVGRDGLLWMILEYRRPDWREGVVERVSADGSVALTVPSYDDQKIYRYRIDVIDLAACNAIASQWVADANIIGYFVIGGDGRATVTELLYGDAGDPLVGVRSIALAR